VSRLSVAKMAVGRGRRPSSTRVSARAACR
jgi:hypothetical protein